MEQKEVKDVKETIRTGGLKDSVSSDKENVRRSEARVAMKTQSESVSSRKRIIKAPVLILKGSKKPKVCYVDIIKCNGQNRSAVRTNNMTNGEDKVTNSNRNSDKTKRTNKTTLLENEVSYSVNTKSSQRHLYMPESTWYEPIDRDGTDLVTRKSNGTRSRLLPRLSEKQLRKLPLCPEIPPGLCKCL